MAKYHAKHAVEEETHASKFNEFLKSRGIAATPLPIKIDDEELSDLPLSVFEAVYAHEQEVTAKIKALYHLAKKVGDKGAIKLTLDFIAEQKREEKTALEDLNLVKDSKDKHAEMSGVDAVFNDK